MSAVNRANGRTVDVPPVATVNELTPAWLSRALGADVSVADSVPVGTGQMGACYRITLEGDDQVPRTLLAKLPAAEQATREFLHGSYSTEVTFYRDILHTVAVNAPRSYYAKISDDEAHRGTFTLLLEDLAPASQGDQIAGCTRAEALRAVENIAGLHAPRWCDPSLLDIGGITPAGPDDAEMMDALFPAATEDVLTMLGAGIAAEDGAILREVAAFGGRWSLARSDRYSLVHGDYRLDNLMFHDDGRLWAVDWQTVAIGLPARDVAFFLSTGLRTDDRRLHERELVEAYRARLLGLGVTDYSEDECWDDYRFAMLQGPLIAVFGCAYSSVRTERGDQMFARMIERACHAIRDLGTLDLLRAL